MMVDCYVVVRKSSSSTSLFSQSFKTIACHQLVANYSHNFLLLWLPYSDSTIFLLNKASISKQGSI